MIKKILLAQDTIDSNDFKKLSEWIATQPRLTKGEKTIEYEEKYAAIVGRKHAVFVNSGSSANLIALYALIATGSLKNTKIVVPALAWITTISPVIQFNCKPILCDINFDDLSVDLNQLEKIFIEQQPACFILVTVLGLVPDMDRITELCKQYDVILLVDNCESQGSKFKGRNIETYGLMSQCSSYYGHIISTIEGGIITTDDDEMYNTLKMLRSHGWDRDIDEERKSNFRKKWSVEKFNSLYTFYLAGFNVRNTEIGAMLGIWQLEKLQQITEYRYRNYQLYNKHLKNIFWKPKINANFVSNLGYPVIHHKREEIVKALTANNVEVRPLISGGMGTQPFFVERYGKKEFENVNITDKYGFYVPNNPMLTEQDIIFVCEIINKFNNVQHNII